MYEAIQDSSTVIIESDFSFCKVKWAPQGGLKIHDLNNRELRRNNVWGTNMIPDFASCKLRILRVGTVYSLYWIHTPIMFLMCSLVTLLNSGWNFFSPDSLNLLVLLACNDFVSLDISCLRNFTMHDLGTKYFFSHQREEFRGSFKVANNSFCE